MVRHLLMLCVFLGGIVAQGQTQLTPDEKHMGLHVCKGESDYNCVVQEAWGTEGNGGADIDPIAEGKLILEMEKQLDVYHYGEVYGCSCTTLTNEGKDVGFSNGVDPFCNKRAKQMWPQSKQQYVAVCGWAKLPLNTPVNTIEDDLSDCTNNKHCELPPIKPPLAREDEVYGGSQRWGDGSVQFVQGMDNSGTLLPWTSAVALDVNEAAKKAADETDGKPGAHIYSVEELEAWGWKKSEISVCKYQVFADKRVELDGPDCPASVVMEAVHPAEPVDVTAVQVDYVARLKGEYFSCGLNLCTADKDIIEQRPGCSDTSRVLLTSEDGKKWCHKVQP